MSPTVEEVSQREIVGEEECLLMALYSPSYDPELRIATKSAFMKPNTSVSRKCVLDVCSILQILIAQIATPTRKIERYACINVADILTESKPVSNVNLVVTADPTAENSSHAEIIAFNEPAISEKKVIRPRVPVSLAKALCRRLRYHDIPSQLTTTSG